MSNDMSGPLSDKPDGTTHDDQVAIICIPAGECSNKEPNFLPGYSEALLFLAW